MDPLSQTIALLRPRALLWKQLEARGDWGIQFPPSVGIVFTLVGAGRCVFQASGHNALTLEEGDFLILSRPPQWSLGHDVRSPLTSYDPSRVETGGRINRIGGAGAPTRIFGGRFVFDDANAALLDRLVPAVVVVRSSDEGARGLRAALHLLGEEAAADRPGRALLLERLLEVVLIKALRHAPPAGEAGRLSLLAGLADPKIGAALRAVHADAGHSWTVGKLAAISGMSRSVFAERFSLTVGMAPIDYLLHWRMALAKDALRAGGKRLAEVAVASGYRSVGAFSTAFARTVGCPPSQYAAAGRARGARSRPRGRPAA